MRKMYFGVLITVCFILAGCAINPSGSDSKNGTVTTDVGGASMTFVIIGSGSASKGIEIIPHMVIEALISLIDASSNSIATNWKPGDPAKIVYNSIKTGSYTLRVEEKDDSGASYTDTAPLNIQNGYNYTINLTLGGHVNIDIDSTNTNIQPVVFPNYIVEVYYTAPGPDGQWFTSDDIAGHYKIYFNNNDNNIEYSTGPDGKVLTSDDQVLGYWTNTDRSGHYCYNAGPDNIWFTGDDTFDTVNSWRHDINGHEIIFSGKGPDGTWLTPDDIVSGYYRDTLNENGSITKRVRISGVGGDGVWFTSDDQIGQDWFGKYWTGEYDRNTSGVYWSWKRYISYKGPGPDGIWETSDDEVNNFAVHEFGDGTIFYTKEITYSSPGSDGLLFTSDDVISGYSIAAKYSVLPPITEAIIPVSYPVAPYTDVRNSNLSSFDLGYDLIKTFWFNKTTILKPADQTYADNILEKGKNPGLGVNYLHSQNITGKGVNVAIIDQNLCQDFGHPEFSGKIAAYFDTGTGLPANSGSMHGPAVASLLVGTHIGTAPGARLYFAAAPSWTGDAKYYAQALDWIIAQNNSLPVTNKIRVVSVSAAPSGEGSPFTQNNILWDQAVQRARDANILVLVCGQYIINDRGYYDLENPDDITKFKPGAPDYTPAPTSPATLFVPASLRTQAEEYDNGVYSYQYTGKGGMSWTIPYIAGVLAMGWQVNPALPITKITNYLYQTAYVLPGGYKVINPTNFIKTIQNNLTADIKAIPGAVWVSPGSQSVANGNTTFIEIHVNTGTSSLAGYNIELTYNSAILGAPVVTACPTGFVTTTDTTTPGTIKVTGAYAAGKGPGTDLAVFRVTFTAIGMGSSIIGLKINSLTDQNSINIGTRNNINGSITVN